VSTNTASRCSIAPSPTISTFTTRSRSGWCRSIPPCGSNLSVGLPLDVLIARRDVYDAELNYRIEPEEPYFHDLRERWSAALRAAHANIPRPPYKTAH
jgi:hypothetical protein